jgi:hypothetical protein
MDGHQAPARTKQWSCGVLDTIEAIDVPGDYLHCYIKIISSKNDSGTVLLFPEYASKATTALEEQHGIERNDEKLTADGIVLSPQPEETLNDPLNFPIWRRNAALLALGLYCMLGGGMAPLLATGFP